MNDQSPVGVIGVGLMGGVFSKRLLDAGFAVAGYDIVSSKNTWLNETGGKASASGRDLARRCDVIVVMVFSTEQAEDVIENDILGGAGEGSNRIVLCSGTYDPERVAALGARVSQRGIRFLETPVSGTSDQCRRGQGVGLIGGDPALAAEVAPVLDALYPRRFHIGEWGDASRAKIAINLILGLNRVALAEGLAFVERVGLDPSRFLEIAKVSAAYSQVMETKGRKMIHGDYQPEGQLQVSLKDATLMREQGRRAGQELPMVDAYVGLIQACMRQGQAEIDSCSIIEEIRRRRS